MVDREQLCASLLAALEAEAAQHGIDIVHVELTGASRQPTLTVRIDKLGQGQPPITLDEVSEHSPWISRVIEQLDPIATPYVLEVSSPGLDRPLRRPRDFERFAHETVVLTTTAPTGRKRYTGELLGICDGYVVLSCSDGEFKFSLDEIRSCKIKPTFDFSEPTRKRK